MATTGGADFSRCDDSHRGEGEPKAGHAPCPVVQDSDRTLVERWQGGDSSAFDQFLDRYKLPILNFIYRLTGDAAGAEDIAQDVFVSVYRNMGRFRFSGSRESCSAWIYQIARNAVLDLVRRKQRHPEVPLEGTGIVESIGSSGPSAVEEAQSHDIGKRIASAVLSLPEDQRTAFVLAEYQDLGYSEISAIMKCSEKSVESRLYRAKQALRGQLHDLLD